MRAGLFTDALADRSLEDALAWLDAELPEVRDVEIGTGGYSPAAHCNRQALLASGPARREWLGAIESAGFRLAAFNASGNPLAQREHDAALCETIRLAAELGVERVVCMSGGDPRLSGGWFPGVEEEAERYIAGRVVPYWREVLAEAGRMNERLRLCLELEPGAAIFNLSTFARLAELGDNVAVNLDPSHFFWQGIDPLLLVERLGDRIGYVHAKDTVLHEDKISLDGVLQRWGEPAWHYTTIGRGHDADWWRSLVDALEAAGYDGVISIEVEDPFLPAEEAVHESARLLMRALEVAA